MRSEPHKEDPKVNMVLRSGMAIEVDRRSLSKEDAGVGKDQPEPVRDPSVITTFLETCITLLRDNRTVKGLQELINRYTGWNEPCVVRKLGRHALWIGRER